MEIADFKFWKIKLYSENKITDVPQIQLVGQKWQFKIQIVQIYSDQPCIKNSSTCPHFNFG